MNTNKKQTWLPVILTLILIIGMIFGYKLREDMGDFTPDFLKSSEAHLLSDALNLIEKKYVDSLKKDSIEPRALSNFLKELDPYSTFISASSLPNQPTNHGIDSAFLLQPATGYIRIRHFSPTTYPFFMEKIETLNKAGMSQMILDLRDNKEGAIEEAVNIADEYIEADKIIATVKSKNLPDKVYAAQRPGQFEKGKMVVLINEKTAGAAELLAAALQDWKRAFLVGKQSTGKALIQESFALKNGSTLLLSVARFYTPLGRCLEKPVAGGLQPDMTVSDEEAIQQSLEWLKR